MRYKNKQPTTILHSPVAIVLTNRNSHSKDSFEFGFIFDFGLVCKFEFMCMLGFIYGLYSFFKFVFTVRGQKYSDFFFQCNIHNITYLKYITTIPMGSYNCFGPNSCRSPLRGTSN